MIHFLSGLPRSGSTVLAAILNQNPLIYVTPTSGLINIIGTTIEKWEAGHINHHQQDEKELTNLLKGIVTAAQTNCKKPILIDKSRAWPMPLIINNMGKVLGKTPKIIATVRDVPDCIASLIRLIKPDDVDDWVYKTHLIDVVKGAYINLLQGYRIFPEAFCFVNYEDLLTNPNVQLKRIHDFLEIDPFNYDLNNIDGNVVAENDDQLWGIPGLHDIKPKLEKQYKQTAQELLGHRYEEFKQPRFWAEEADDSPSNHPLNLQLEAAKRGDFQKAWEISQRLQEDQPKNNRAAFNRGLYVLMQGRLQEGMQLLARGRLEHIFGDRHPNLPTPIWEGQEGQIVLLYLEGGLGDQIHQMRFVQDITARNCRVIVACAPELVKLFATVRNVYAVITKESARGIFHHSWVPGMSGPMPLGIEYKDVWGCAYIPRPQVIKNKFRIGMRWQGNPNFEHDHCKYFPPELLFNAVKGFDVEFVSLQRDEGAQHRPDWIAESNLDSWQDTQLAIAGCDLVISSCTSVAHLSAAMGVPTWIVIPVLPYYLWALPGERTPWYDAIRLFRQTKYQDWTEVFNQVRIALDDYLSEVQHARSQFVG